MKSGRSTQDPGALNGASCRVTCHYEFAEFRLKPEERELLRNGQPVTLGTKSFDVLLMLVQNSRLLLDKAALMDAVWADTVVEENSLARAIADIRKALGEGPKDNRFIETVARRGYRFRAPVINVPARPRRDAHLLLGPLVSSDGATQLITVAVVPFTWLTNGANDQSLSVGMADALITRLSNLSQLVVRPTSAILRYATPHQDLAVIGQELSVDFVISGSIQQAGDRLRVSVQMVSCTRQRSEWADCFDEKLTHLFAVEDSLSERVAAALALKLTSAQRESLRLQYTDNREAYQLNLRGRYFLSKRTFISAKKAIEQFGQALQLDERYALPWAGIADAYILIGLHGALTGWLSPHETYPEAKRAASKAIELEPQLAEAHSSLGFISFFYDWDGCVAEHEFQKALLLKPQYSNAHHWYAMMCCCLGRFEQALASIAAALELEPFSPIVNANRGYILYFARRYAAAVEQLRTTLEMDNTFAATHHHLGLVYAASGRHREAIQHFLEATKHSEESPQALGALGYGYATSGDIQKGAEILDSLLRVSNTKYVSPAILAEVCLGLGQVDEAFEWLAKAVSERSAAIVRLRIDPRFDPFRSDPRFQRVVDQVRTSS